MQKEIGSFKLGNSVPKKLRAVVGNDTLVIKMTSGWNVMKFVKLNIDELLATFRNKADRYTVGWSGKELVIQFFNKEEPLLFGSLRKMLPRGMDFYQKHAGKDMFLGDIIDVLYKEANYTENFLEDIENVDAERESSEDREKVYTEEPSTILWSEQTSDSDN